MSMACTLFVVEFPGMLEWECRIAVDLSSWCFLLGKIPESERHPVDRAVTAAWVGTTAEKRDAEALKDCGIFYVNAKFLKTVSLYSENDTPRDRQVKANVATAVVNALPDDWPVLVYYV